MGTPFMATGVLSGSKGADHRRPAASESLFSGRKRNVVNGSHVDDPQALDVVEDNCRAVDVGKSFERIEKFETSCSWFSATVATSTV